MIGSQLLPAPLEQRIRNMQRSAAWAFAQAWATSPLLLICVTAISLTRGLIPAGLALSARGIVNGAVAGLHSGTPVVAPLLPWLLLGFTLTVVEGLAGLAGPLLRQRQREKLAAKLTTEVMNHAAAMDLAFFEDPRSHDTLQRAKDDPAGHVTNFLANAISAASNALQIGSLIAILMVIEPWVVAVVLLLTVPYLLGQARLSAEQHALDRSRTAKKRWTNYFVSNLTGATSAAEVQLLRLAPILTRRFRGLMEEFRSQDWGLAVRGFTRSAAFITIATAAIYAAFVHVCWRVLHGGLSVGDLAIFGAASARMRQTLETFVQLGTQALAETLYVGDVIDFLAARTRRDETPTVAMPPVSRAGLELHDVHFTYPGAPEPALCGIDLRIDPGETVALVGENGAGKTTLVKLLARLYDPDQGSIRFDGSDLRDLPREELQRRIAFVFQGFGRYEASVADNIAFGDWERLLDDREAVTAVARMAGLEPLVANLSRGLDTTLGRMFGEADLSAGQWQKLAVARAFARQAALLILDEPTSNLDARAEHALFEQFRSLAEGRTTIIVSHRFSTVSMAHRIVVLDKGRVVETGTHAELLARAGHYATLYSLHERTGLRAAG